MKKAKTKNKIFSILCAVLGAVFAFTVGLTYCVSSISLVYGDNPNFISAFLGNQQYHLINDTTTKPVAFGEGTHKFEIALQYAIDYDFDVRVKYSMNWSNGMPTENVILNFVNRNNVIFDDEYIFLANSTAKGNGKISIISGVEFIDVNDERYEGATLTISASAKINKATGYSDLDNNVLYSTATASSGGISVSATAWLENKQHDCNFVTMYNYRRDYEHGASYPDFNTAYQKDVVNYAVDKAVWTGGNRSYAGLGMFISTKDVVSFTISVAGIWRDSDDSETVNGNPVQQDEQIEKDIYEDSAKFNYSRNWTRTSWDSDKLWEIRTFDAYIPAQHSCYVDILDSVEITSGKRVGRIIGDTYRLVINRITLNGQLFSFSEKSNSWIQSQVLLTASGNSAVEPNPEQGTAGTQISSSDIQVVNTSLFNPGLYNANPAGADGQSFDTSISVANTTTSTKTIEVTGTLWYHISNGKTSLYVSESDKRRIEEYTKNEDDTVMTDIDRFKSGLYFAHSFQTSSTITKKITLAPLTSVNVWESFVAPAGLQTTVATTFGTNYDVWVFLQVSVSNASSDLPNESLQIETTQSLSTVDLFVKNNTNKIVTGVTISDFSIKELSEVTYPLVTALTSQPPADWKASFWKYYLDAQGNQQLNAAPTYVQNTYYLRTQGYSTITVESTHLKNSFGFETVGGKQCITSRVELQPGESVKFASFTTSQTHKVHVTGSVVANSLQAPTKVMLIDSGTQNAFLHNTTANSYFVRFGGTYAGTSPNIKTYTYNSGNGSETFNYFIGVLRPGQILDVPMSLAGAINQIEATSTFDSSKLTGWAPDAILALTTLLT